MPQSFMFTKLVQKAFSDLRLICYTLMILLLMILDHTKKSHFMLAGTMFIKFQQQVATEEFSHQKQNKCTLITTYFKTKGY